MTPVRFRSGSWWFAVEEIDARTAALLNWRVR
jgi:hypothetical protein